MLLPDFMNPVTLASAEERMNSGYKIRPDKKVTGVIFKDYVDMRKSADSLACEAEIRTKKTAFDGTVFIFCNKKRDRLKMVYWERNGFVIWYKKLAKYRFKWPTLDEDVTICGHLLNALLDGYEIKIPAPHAQINYTSMI